MSFLVIGDSQKYIYFLIFRYDRPLPTRAVNLMVNNLIHDNLMVRKCAIFVVGNILKQQKRPHKKVQIDTKGDNPTVPGDRPANCWLSYDPQKLQKVNPTGMNQDMFIKPIMDTISGLQKWRFTQPHLNSLSFKGKIVCSTQWL